MFHLKYHIVEKFGESGDLLPKLYLPMARNMWKSRGWAQSFFAKCNLACYLPKFFPAKIFHYTVLNSSELILWHLKPKVLIQKINKQVWLSYVHEEEDDHNHKDEKKEHGVEDRYLSEPQKTHPTGGFVMQQSLVAMHCII